MAYLRTSLVVLTLLQLCRAEIRMKSDKQPESWYAANVINDGFQPKPISEIFSTEASFSSTNPIIVLSKSNEIPDEIALLSTLPPPTRLQSSTIPEGFTSIPPTMSTLSSLPTTEQPLISSTSQSPAAPASSTIAVQFQTSQQQKSLVRITPESQPVPPEIQPILPLVTNQPKMPLSMSEGSPTPLIMLSDPPVIQQSSVPPPAQLDPAVPQSIQPITQYVQSNNTPSSRSQSGQTPLVQSFPSQPAFNQPELQVSQLVTQVPISQTSTLSPQSNYFLIYQQAPQNIQNYPLPPQTSVGTSQSSVVSAVTSQPTIAQPAATVIAPSLAPSTTFPPTLNTVNSTIPITTKRTTKQPTIASSQNTSSPSSVTTPIPRTLTPFSAYPLRIRVIAPPGSITNIRLNPTTTTKKPKTPRTRKPKPKARKNSYDVCIDSCKGRRDPICAAPLSPGLIDPNNLKGFPSICHMACHNSFKKDAYEKLVDGRCGKLRTRIRTVDSNTKLKRDELNKAVYTLDNTGPRTIVEVSGPI